MAEIGYQVEDSGEELSAGLQSSEVGLGSSGTQVWAFGGGKGGIGKSFVTANIAVNLAQQGKKVIVVDADLGGANIHTCLGIPYPKRTLAHFLNGSASSLEEIRLETSVPGLSIISGASDILGMANPQWSQKQKLLRHLRRLSADYLLLDLGAGTTYNVLDFFNAAPRKIVVVTPEPTSIQNAYGFIKNALFRHLGRHFHANQLVKDLLSGGKVFGGDVPPETVKQMLSFLNAKLPDLGAEFESLVRGYQCELILNMASPPQDRKVYSVMRSVSKGYLDLDLELLGAIPKDERVSRSVDQMCPLAVAYPDSEPAKALAAIASRLTNPSFANLI